MLTFREILDSDAQKTLKWRSQARISDMMLSDIPDRLEHQLAWIQACRNRPDFYFWMFQKDGQDAGVLSIWLWPDDANAMNIGVYIGEPKLGFVTLPVLQTSYSYIFSTLRKKAVHLQMREGNKVIQLQEYLGFTRYPALDLTVSKNGTPEKFLGYSLKAEEYRHKNRDEVHLPMAMRKFGNEFYFAQTEKE